LDKGIIPTFQSHSSSEGIDIIILSYNIQKESCKYLNFIGHTKSKLIYAGGIGVNLNRSKSYYDSVLLPYTMVKHSVLDIMIIAYSLIKSA